MSTNIDSVRVLRNDGFRISPEDCFLFDLPFAPVPDLDYQIERSSRHGEGSGNTYERLIEDVLPLTMGAIDVAFTWEGGEGFTGVRAVDGVVTQHKVEIVLGAVLS